MIELRFVKRDNQKILQYRNKETIELARRAYDCGYNNFSQWRDVPMAEEE